ncbi:hypothetical protein RQP46_008647 [Phenoliferia psychrophenolica]
MPQVLFVDGNGRLHPREAGAAVAVGLATDIPTLGVAKEYHPLDAESPLELEPADPSLPFPREFRSSQKGMRLACKHLLRKRGDWIGLSGSNSPTEYIGAALRTSPDPSSTNPVFVSSGHRLSLESSLRMVMASCSASRVPEPIRQADAIAASPDAESVRTGSDVSSVADDTVTVQMYITRPGQPRTSSVSFKCRRTTRFKKLFERVALEEGFEGPDCLNFIADGDRIARDQTVGDALDGEDEMEVDAIPVLRGGKPVIYLFPTTALTSVDVTLSLVPSWTLSALYPIVPITRSKSLSDLFWEAETAWVPPSPSLFPSTAVQAFNPAAATLDPSNSILLPFTAFLPYLDGELRKLTLHTAARNDMITYWLPELLKIQRQGMDVAMRFVEQAAYEQAAKLEVEPVPDVVTRVFMLFKGVSAEEGVVGGVWDEARERVGEVDWRSVVGVEEDAEEATKFRVLEWGGMAL